jgi:hypothetical protein
MLTQPLGSSIRYTLLLCEAIKKNEGAHTPPDVAQWQTAASLSARWVMKMAEAQAEASAGGPAGSNGLPQKIDPASDKGTTSATSGRYMNAVPVFARLVGDDWEPGSNTAPRTLPLIPRHARLPQPPRLLLPHTIPNVHVSLIAASPPPPPPPKG